MEGIIAERHRVILSCMEAAVCCGNTIRYTNAELRARKDNAVFTFCFMANTSSKYMLPSKSAAPIA